MCVANPIHRYVCLPFSSFSIFLAVKAEIFGLFLLTIVLISDRILIFKEIFKDVPIFIHSGKRFWFSQKDVWMLTEKLLRQYGRTIPKILIFQAMMMQMVHYEF